MINSTTVSPTTQQNVNNSTNTSNDPNNTSIRKLSFKQREDLIKSIYQEILGKTPTYKEIDQFAYKDITPNQIRLALLNTQEFKEILKKANDYNALKQKIELLKSELKQVLWIVKSLQEQIKAKIELLKIKKLEIRKMRQFIKKLSKDYPEGPSAFFCTIYKTEYTQIINKKDKQNS